MSEELINKTMVETIRQVTEDFMRKILIGLLVLSSASAFANDNCKLTGKEKSSGGVIIMPWIKHVETKSVNDISECVEEAKTLLNKKIDRYDIDGRRYLGEGSFKFVRFQFNDGENQINGVVKH
jgi:hypothetical protein